MPNQLFARPSSARGSAPAHPLAVLLAALTLLAWHGPAAAEKRVALVIGNSAYQHTPALKNPSNDASDVASKLRGLGFDVIDGTDLTKSEMESRIRSFAAKLQNADVGLFFYAGHGLAVDGKNYLAPVDAKLESETDLDFEAVELDLVLKQMERNSRVSLVFLDACRDNPMAVSLASASRSLAVARGLARVDRAVGMMIAFSTQPGNVALDGEGRNSPFTDALLHHIDTQGESVNDLMIDVRKDVLQATDGKQVPWENSSLTGQFFFKPAEPKTAADESAETDQQIAALRQEIDRLQADQGARLKSQQEQLEILQQKLQSETTKAAGQTDASVAAAEPTAPSAPTPSATHAAATPPAETERVISVEPASPATPPAPTSSADAGAPAAATAAQAPAQAVSQPDTTKVAIAEPNPAEAPTEPAPPSVPALPAGVTRQQLSHDILVELKDLGCYYGSVNSSWNGRTREALGRFNRVAKLDLPLDDPAQASLDALKTWTGDGCAPEHAAIPAPPPQQPVPPRSKRPYREQAHRYAPGPEREASSPPPPRHSGTGGGGGSRGGGGSDRVDEQQEVQKFLGVH